MKCYSVFFIIFIDGLSRIQNGAEISTYENIKSIFGELLTGAIGIAVTGAIAGYGVLMLLLEVLSSGSNGYSGPG